MPILCECGYAVPYVENPSQCPICGRLCYLPPTWTQERGDPPDAVEVLRHMASLIRLPHPGTTLREWVDSSPPSAAVRWLPEDTLPATCPCALAVRLDYAGRDQHQVALVHRMIEQRGEFTTLIHGGVTYRVSRHCIALHGVAAERIAAYGFEVVEPPGFSVDGGV